ncbi:Com family DNA-binding transcriptional regulator [Chitinimonas koreensis]|nr:Com family DNA-binding transcriptional regulator [Chitinimonas koreensis]QNM96399.1 Com family DNA-binding transcriptional regulator [Chitinimonas koreensis]
METIRCTSCNRKLAEARAEAGFELAIKCPRCRAYNIWRAARP